jgi:putative ABC transport system ATP-binding protein
MSEILKLEHVKKLYTSGSKELVVLDDICFDIKKAEVVSIVGPSGSGKTTLLGLCAGLDQVTEGSVHLCGQELNRLSENQRAKLRNEKVGFVFQNFQLVPSLTALENVMIPLELRAEPNAASKAHHWLERVGLAERARHYPSQLSGGEQQRVSIARAFINDPEILFADEPTGNLDEATGEKIEALLFGLNKEKNTTLVLVTHDLELAARTGRTIRLRGGKIVSDSTGLNPNA